MGTILVSGGTGFVGSAIVKALRMRGDRAVVLTRSAGKANGTRPGGLEDQVEWDPVAGTLDPRVVREADGVINLAGSPIAEGRWTDDRKRDILESRTRSTRLLATTVAQARREGVGPTRFVSASAVGYYGSRGDQIVSEESTRGDGFLPEVCEQWEAATAPLRTDGAGVRLSIIRIGLVLGAGGGALSKMLTPFRLGAGGPIGDGRQWMSWIHLDDLVSVVLRLLDDDQCSGPYNAVSPGAVRNREFVTELGHALRRPALMPMPGFAVRLLFGEMGERLLLEGQHVIPARLRNIDFAWKHGSLKGALRSILELPA